MDDVAVLGLAVIALAALITIFLGVWLRGKERKETPPEEKPEKPTLIIRANTERRDYGAKSAGVSVIYEAENHGPRRKCRCCGCEYPVNAAACDICGTLL